MWQNAENYPHYWWELTNNVTSKPAAKAAGDILLVTAALPILYAFLTLIYGVFMPYSPVTVTLDFIPVFKNYQT